MLVSIIIPLYNAKNYIADIVSNINNQTYKNIEVIFVDDGSCDGTLELLKDEKLVLKATFLKQKKCRTFCGEK